MDGWKLRSNSEITRDNQQKWRKPIFFELQMYYSDIMCKLFVRSEFGRKTLEFEIAYLITEKQKL